jgi:Zn finger protein HypA/HybF involved in hydrogenase expression
MTQLPKGPPNREIRTGDQGPGFQCKNCGYGIPIGGSLATLPESFEVKCPTCQEIRTYRPNEIQLLTAALKQ